MPAFGTRPWRDDFAPDRAAQPEPAPGARSTTIANTSSHWLAQVNGYSNDGTSQTGLGGHSDWRLPTNAELQSILIAPFPCGTIPCIDPIFGPTVPNFYWSSTIDAAAPGFNAWGVYFGNGNLSVVRKNEPTWVRAVRDGL